MILAYIDPGSGSILVQVILASCIGGLAIFWSKVKSLFSKRKHDNNPPIESGKKPE